LKAAAAEKQCPIILKKQLSGNEWRNNSPFHHHN